jgi:hypothetical protein
MQGTSSTTRVVSSTNQTTTYGGQSTTSGLQGNLTGTRTLGTSGTSQPSVSYQSNTTYKPTTISGTSGNQGSYSSGQSTSLAGNYLSAGATTTGTSSGSNTLSANRTTTGTYVSSSGTTSGASYPQGGQISSANYSSNQPSRISPSSTTVTGVTGTSAGTGQYTSYSSNTNTAPRVVSGTSYGTTTTSTATPYTGNYSQTTQQPSSNIISATGSSGATQTLNRPSSTVQTGQGITSTGGAQTSYTPGNVIRATQPSSTTNYSSNTTVYGADPTSYTSNTTYRGNSTTLGGNTTTLGGAATTYGGNTTSLGGNSTTLGGATTAYGGNATSLGGNTTTLGGATTTYGGNTTSLGGNTTTIGGATTTYGGNATSLGGNTTTLGSNTKNYGGNTTTYGGNTTTYGGNTTSLGSNSTSLGTNKTTIGGTTISAPQNTTYGANQTTYGTTIPGSRPTSQTTTLNTTTQGSAWPSSYQGATTTQPSQTYPSGAQGTTSIQRPATIPSTGNTVPSPANNYTSTSIHRTVEVQYAGQPSKTNVISQQNGFATLPPGEKNVFEPLGRTAYGHLSATGEITRQANLAQTGYGLELDDEDEDDDNVEDRRFTEDTARTLARILFGRYDENRSGFLNSFETSSLITDFYCSLNIDHPSSRKEGFDFMVANDINNDGQFSVKDFEDIFVHHLSTGNNQSGFRLFSERKVSSVKSEFCGRGETQVSAKAPTQAPGQAATAETVTGQAQTINNAQTQLNQRFQSSTGRSVDSVWETHQQTILAQIREKGRQEGFDRGLKDATQMANLLQQGGAADNYQAGFKLGLEHGLDDGQRRADETHGVSHILFNEWKWQPEIIKAASNMIEHKEKLPVMDEWHWQEAILIAANQIWKEQESQMLAIIHGQVTATPGNVATPAQPQPVANEAPKQPAQTETAQAPGTHFQSQIDQGAAGTIPAPINPIKIPEVPASH